jgi:hypothetical protein
MESARACVALSPTELTSFDALIRNARHELGEDPAGPSEDTALAPDDPADASENLQLVLKGTGAKKPDSQAQKGRSENLKRCL